MERKIVHLLGGRVAEKLTLGDISTGASNDIERATDIARDMVTKYGMSDRIGPVNFSSSDEVFLGKDFTTHRNFSEETANEIDEEVRRIVEEAFTKCEKLITENIGKLHDLAHVLLEVETLDGEQFERLMKGEITADELILELRNEQTIRKEKQAKEAAEHLKEMKESEAKEKADDEAKKRLLGDDNTQSGGHILGRITPVKKTQEQIDKENEENRK